MLFLLLAFALPYFALFVIALFMPGRRSLQVLAALIGLPLAWLVLEGFRSLERAPGGAGLGILVVTAAICTAAAGLLSGVATRAVMLWNPRIRQSRICCAGLVLLGFLCIPSVLGAASWWSQMNVRVPDDACLTATHHVKLAGRDLWLPSAPLFTPWLGEKKPYAFSSHPRMRAFCGISLDADEPIHIVNLTIEGKELRYKGPPQRDKFCASSRQDWATLLCNAGKYSAESSDVFPAKISVYSPTGYDHRRMLVSDRGAYATAMKERAAAIQSGQALQEERTNGFIRFSNGYWIAADARWKNDAGEPYTLYCYETAPTGMFNCTTTYRLRLGPHVTYSFRARQDALASASKTVDANFHAFMKSLMHK